MKYRQSKPKRIKADFALDFYQIWFGNRIGQELFEQGDHKHMPDAYEFELWGENIIDSVWFKKILMGEVEEGYVVFDGTYEGTVNSWNDEWGNTF